MLYLQSCNKHHSFILLTHCGLWWHMLLQNFVIIGLGNVLSYIWCQAITWTNADLMSIVPSGTNFKPVKSQSKYKTTHTAKSGLPRSGKSRGNSSLSQSQGKVREVCCKSGNFLICYQVREKSGNFVCGPYCNIFFIIWQMIFEIGQNLKLCPHSNIIHQMIFF